MNRPLTRKEWLASLQKAIDEFDWDAAYNDEPKREWVGLTDEEAIDLAVKVSARLDLPPATKMQLQQQFIDALRKPDSLWMFFAAEVEAKLKEKNT